MIQKLFGETEEEQFEYLKRRFVILGVGVAVLLIGFLLQLLGIGFKVFADAAQVFYSLSGIICLVVLFNFGWAILRGLFGVASVGILFSNNVVLGVIIFMLYVGLGYIGGLVVGVIGLCRFLVLLKKRK